MDGLISQETRLRETFCTGDEVILAEGTYQRTPGVFLRLRADRKWADIQERNGIVREHPVDGSPVPPQASG